MMRILIRLVVLALLLHAAAAAACTTFLISAGPQVRIGKSYDWDLGQGLVLFNKRGVAKRAALLKPGDKPAEWVSRHASLTFNQYGREFPNGGMNDAGLVVEIMWLEGSVYPPSDERPAIGELPWIQFQLDNFDNVSQAVAHADDVRISKQYASVHYLLCDRNSVCAVFEHINGKLVVRFDAEVPVKVLTNNTYEQSLAYLTSVGKAAPAGAGSLQRFARTALHSKQPQSGDLTRRALALLDEVNVGPHSRWNIVYDPVALQVAFRTSDHRQVRSVDLKAFDPSCAAPVKMLDLQAALAGDVTARFSDYSDQANERLITQTTAPIAAHLPPGAVAKLARFPSSLTCRAAP